MSKILIVLKRVICLFLLLAVANQTSAQTLKLSDFAIWGGGNSPNPYNKANGVFISNTANIKGDIGSNHLVSAENNLVLSGNIYSGNLVTFKNNAAITGNIFASRSGTTLTPTISGGKNTNITGNLTAKGKITLGSGKVSGQVAVSAPASSNYTGPTPSGGVSTSLNLPVLPVMPNNTQFDNEVGTTIISSTQTIVPGNYRRLALTGNQTVRFDGPGNYVFYEVDNRVSTNKLVFDFKNSSSGIINIFIIKDARWGLLSVSTVNGNFPSRIYTEVHGNGSTLGGNAFDLQSPATIPAGSNIWLGNVWAPNGGISINNTKPSATPHIIGALWSGKSVTIKNDLRLQYTAPAADLGYIDPYYPPPVEGKVIPEFDIIGAELFALIQNPVPISTITQNEIFRLDNNGNVMIEVVSKTANDNTLRQELVALGMTGIVDNGPDVFIISGNFPISNLPRPELRNNPRIQYVRPLFPPISNAGQVTSQGDSTMRSNMVRSRFGLDGAGVKVGVISDSYNSKGSAQQDVDQGDLPGIKSSSALPPNENATPVQAPSPDPISGSDEGRAMLQIVHDVAPKAKLAFRSGFITAGDFARNIQELASPTLPDGKCDIIVDDITYITEPFLRDGIVAQTVNQVVNEGVTYFSSAGNFGQQSYESVFSGVTNPSVIPAGEIHRFGSTDADIFQTINLKPGSYTIVLQWSDEFHSLGSAEGVQNDMDLYMVGSSGYTLFGFNRSNLFGDPFEVCPFTVTEETNAKLMVVRAAGTGTVRFKYIIFRGPGTLTDYPTGNSSLVGHANAEGAIAVGAMLYANIPGVTPIWPSVASFSSRGGTYTLQSDNLFSQRNKPEIIGPNGVNTTVNLGGPIFNDGDSYFNFFGTSAAAPHVAAVGALIVQARKKFNLQTVVTPSEIREQLISSAGKFANLPGNFSFEGGYGYTQADSAIAQIANARPIISSLEAVVPGAQNGSEPFEVKIKGQYLTPNTQIYFDGAPMPTAISSDRTEAIATIPAITNELDPAFQLYNPPKSASELDGGLSEALRFFSSRVAITVRAINKSRRYGETNPVFDAEILYNGVVINDADTLAKLQLNGDNISFLTIATQSSGSGLYGIFPARTTPLAIDDPLLNDYGFTFISGTLSVGKMPLKIIPNNKTVRYGEDLGEITYSYEMEGSVSPSLVEQVEALHRRYLADNALVVLHGFNNPTIGLSISDLDNMSMMASFQSLRNARKFVLEDGRMTPLVNDIPPSQIGDQRFIVDVSAQSLVNYKVDSAQAPLVPPFPGIHARAFLNIKALERGNGRVTLAGGPLTPVVNGQLLAMVNGQLQALVNGQLKAMVNDIYVDAENIVFQNGQLLALVNGAWIPITNGQLLAMVNGLEVSVEISLNNGQLQAIVNGQLMALVNGQLQAMVNGQLLALVNGQLKAMVNGQLMPLVNGQLVAMVNGQLQPMVNGQLLAMVNGQLMALVNGELELVQDITLSNGQLQAIINGQLQALVNGQLKAMVNGVVTDIPTTDLVLANGQLQALVNGQLQALVNGQLQPMVNGQLQPLVNGDATPAESARQLANGQLQALVNGTYIPITNGQLQAVVNGQLLAMVNGQLMAIVNGELTFTVFQNGQLQALVNGQLQALVNGQLKAMVNGQLQEVNSYSIVNGQLQALVNGQTWVYANGQLLALVNGQLQPLVNSFDVSGANNNTKTLLLVDEDDINLQAGAIGGMFSINMITGLDVGNQTLVAGGFINGNFEVTYGTANIEITPALLTAKADSTTKVYGDENPEFTISYSGFAYDDNEEDIVVPVPTSIATNSSGVGNYPVVLNRGGATNYDVLLLDGNLQITKRSLLVKAEDKSKLVGTANPPLTISYTGLVGDDTRDSICLPYIVPPTPAVLVQLNRRTTYTDVKLNGGSNFINAQPGETINLAGTYNSEYFDPTDYCPGCITQIYIGMSNPGGAGALFSNCYDVSGTGAFTGNFSQSFSAPLSPGVYYITQVTSWEFACYDRGAGAPGNNSADAIAVVVVNVSKETITANTSANASSPTGAYPITLQGCSNYNPNYDVVLQDGVLTVGGFAATKSPEVALAESNPVMISDKLYPNPATTVLTLQLKEEVQRTSDIQVFDQVGKQSRVSITKTGERLYNLNVMNLSKGIYYVKLKTSSGLRVLRFVKN